MLHTFKNNFNAVFLALATTLCLFGVIVATGFVFSSSNPASKLAMLVGSILMVVGLIQPRRMLMLMVPITFYLDGVKRLLTVGGKTSLDEVTAVLAVAPLGAVGIIIGCVIHRIFHRRAGSAAERLTIFAAIGAFVGFGGLEAFTAGNLLYSLKTVANSTVYFLLPWTVLQCFRTREEVERFLKYCLVAGIPVALYGIWQYTVGLSDFEITYLRSGLTTVGEASLDDIRPRPFSTLSSPTSYSCVMAFMLALSAHFTASWNGGRKTRQGLVITVIYAAALLLSMARGAALTGIAMVLFAKWFRTKTGTVLAYSFFALFFSALILFAQPLLDSLGKFESYLPSDSVWQQQAFRLGTISDRLIGYRNVLANPASWPLVANPLNFHPAELSYGDSTFSHDLFSQIILRIGAIPAFMGLCVGIFVLWRAHRTVLSLPAGKTGIRTLAARLLAIIVLFVLSQSGGSGMTVFPINFWLGIFVGLAIVICIQDRKGKKLESDTAKTAASAVPAIAAR